MSRFCSGKGIADRVISILIKTLVHEDTSNSMVKCNTMYGFVQRAHHLVSRRKRKSKDFNQRTTSLTFWCSEMKKSGCGDIFD
jgi:hypothetical protein